MFEVTKITKTYLLFPSEGFIYHFRPRTNFLSDNLIIYSYDKIFHLIRKKCQKK
jgi:hypothetical protein